MPAIAIDSIDDPRISPFRDLPHSRLPKDSGLFIAEGALVVERLLDSDFEVDSLFVETPRVKEFAGRVAPDVPVYAAEKRLFQRILGFHFHRCVLACGRRRPNPPLDQLFSALSPQATVVVCDAVHDPENLGGVLRNSAAFGADLILLGQRCADPFSRRVLRVSMGTVFRQAIIESEDLAADLAHLRGHYRFELIAAVLDSGATPLRAAERRPRAALLLGNEAHGLNGDLLALCDRQVTIPMRRGTDSLNVAVASGILLYHFTAG